MRLLAPVLLVSLLLFPGPASGQDRSPDRPLVTGAFGWELGRVLEDDAGARQVTEFAPLLRLLDATPPDASRHFSFYNVLLCRATREIQGIVAIQTFADMEEAERHFQALSRLLTEKYGPSLEDPKNEGAFLAGQPDTGRSVRLSPPVDDGAVIKVVVEYYDDPLWTRCLEGSMESDHALDLKTL